MFTVLRSSTLRTRQNAEMRDMDRRLLADHARLAQGIGLLISQQARAGVVPNTRASRDALSQGAWERVLKPYYVGQGEPLRGTIPQSPYAAVLVAGVTSAVRLQVDWHTAMLKRYIRNERVLAWLTGPRPLPSPVRETLQDSFAQWLDQRGFKLADRIQRMAVEIKARMSRFFDYHIGKGTPAGAMTERAAQFLTTGEKGARPYGPQAAYPARRLLQNEMIVAGGSATQNLSRVNPIVMAMKWVVSPAHTESDECDDNANGGPDGDGVYSFELLPVYPSHVKCQCGIFPVAVARPAEITATLLAGIEQGDAYTASLQGLFNDQWVTDALKSGSFEPAAERVIAAKPAVRIPAAPSRTPPLTAVSAPVPRPRPAQPATPTIELAYRPGEAQLNAVAKHIDEQIADVAKAYRVTPQEVERSITQAFAKLTAENRLAIQFPSQHIDSLLTDGRFKTQFETGKGEGITNTTYRANAEQRGIGAPLDLDPKARSVYAFLDAGPGARANVRDYGDITFIFKEETKARATVTVGDSLFNFAQREVAGTPVLSPTRHSWDTSVEALYDYATGGTTSELTGQVRYIEAQIQRGASLADVRAVVDRGALSAAQRTALRDLGIEIWDN